mgnify:CR=1 FL=1
MDDEEFLIEDLQGFAASVRSLVFRNMGVEDEELEQPTVAQVAGFISEICPVVDGDRIIGEDTLHKIAETVKEALVGAALSELASEGKVECAWDDKSNSMVFWAPKKD